MSEPVAPIANDILPGLEDVFSNDLHLLGMDCHFVWQNRHDLVLPLSALPANADAVLLETGANTWIESWRRSSLVQALSQTAPHSAWFPAIIGKNIDLVLGDVTGDLYVNGATEAQRDFNARAQSVVLAGLGVLGLAASLSRPMTRRGFLKGAVAAGGAGAACWLGLMPINSLMERGSLEGGTSQLFDRVNLVITRLKSLTHPEDEVILFRNLVAAAKIGYLAKKNNQRGVKENLTVSFGRAHVGLDNLAALGPVFCADLLGTLYPEIVFRAACAGLPSPADLATIARGRLDETGQWVWQEEREPNLLRVIKDKIN